MPIDRNLTKSSWNVILVDGGYTEWSQWSLCDNPCGGSIVNRTRACTNPTPTSDGQPCSGAAFETKLSCISPCPSKSNFGHNDVDFKTLKLLHVQYPSPRTFVKNAGLNEWRRVHGSRAREAHPILGLYDLSGQRHMQINHLAHRDRITDTEQSKPFALTYRLKRQLVIWNKTFYLCQDSHLRPGLNASIV